MHHHNKTKTRIYYVYVHMMARCYKPYDKAYARYGGRGIQVCDEWREDPNTFFKWAEENGYRECEYGLCTLDRIDVNGDYCPENCRWVDNLTQANNKRNTKYMTFKGEKVSVSEVARRTGLKYHTIYNRLSQGYSDEEAVLHLGDDFIHDKLGKGEIKRGCTLTDKKTREVYSFESMSAASRWLRHTPSYIATKFNRCNKTSFEIKDYFVEIGGRYNGKNC